MCWEDCEDCEGATFCVSRPYSFFPIFLCIAINGWGGSQKHVPYWQMFFNVTGLWRQGAQRATIAHLSPMCQDQISFQKTYKWAMETRGPKSNSSGLLCLSWLPATLMMIRSKMNKLAWRHHFPITGLWEIFYTSRASNSLVSVPIRPKFELVQDFMHVLVTSKYKKDRIKNNQEKVETSFSQL